jgi:hypothetical protein
MKRKLVFSVIAMGIAFCGYGQNCKQFINYQAKTIDFKGLSVNLLGKASGNSDGLSSKPVIREASEEIQKLDLLQYNMCNQMKSCKSDYVREKLAYQQNNIMMKMLNLQEGNTAIASTPVEEEAVPAVAETTVTEQTVKKTTEQIVENADVDVEVTFPCSGESFYSTDDIIRATGEGWSMDAQTAKRSARTAALEELAAKIEITVKTLTEDYQISTKKAMDEQFESRLENKTQTIVNQTLSGWKTVCEKTLFNKEKKKYTHYMAIEISVSRVLEGVYSKLRADAELKNAVPPRQEFEQKFNEIMGEYEQSNEAVME